MQFQRHQNTQRQYIRYLSSYVLYTVNGYDPCLVSNITLDTSTLEIVLVKQIFLRGKDAY